MYKIRVRQSTYVPSSIQIEGRGIKRGLTPPEVAVILGKPVGTILSLVLIGLLKKEVIRLNELSPIKMGINPRFPTRITSINAHRRSELRLKAAQTINAILHPFEEPFLELLDNPDNEALRDINFTVAMIFLIKYVAYRIGEFNFSSTRDYYRNIIERASKEARIKGTLITDPNKVLEYNLEWVLLDDQQVNSINTKYIPKWITSFNSSMKIDKDISFSNWWVGLRKELRFSVSHNKIRFKGNNKIDRISKSLWDAIVNDSDNR
jgi:hypothetical protein